MIKQKSKNNLKIAFQLWKTNFCPLMFSFTKRKRDKWVYRNNLRCSLRTASMGLLNANDLNKCLPDNNCVFRSSFSAKMDRILIWFKSLILQRISLFSFRQKDNFPQCFLAVVCYYVSLNHMMYIYIEWCAFFSE